MSFDPEIEALLGPAAGHDLAMGGAYEGASTFSRDLALWTPILQSADAEILLDKGLADARSRDLVRNDAYVQGGQQLHKDNIVGSMFVLNAKPEYGVLGQSEAWAQAFQEEVETKFMLWAESPANWVDAARTKSLTAMVRLAVASVVTGGEVLATVEWLRDAPRPFNTAIQMVDTDRLSNPYTADPRLRIRGGVEQNAYGAPQAYWIRDAHPVDVPRYDAGDAYQWTRVPATKPWGRPQVIHLFEENRIDQSRGISDMVAALKEMKITKKFRDITLQAAVVNATYAATIESDLPPDAAFAALGGGQTGGVLGGSSMGAVVNDYSGNYLSAIQAYIKASKGLAIDGVKIPHLYPGTKLNIRNIGVPGGVGQDFESSLLRYIATNLGVSFEQLSRNYSQSNYSSIRAAMTETWKFMQSRKKIIADRFASIVYRLWLEEAINKGVLETVTARSPNFYDGLNAEAYTACEWIGANRGQIDELKETQAAVLRLQNNLSTQEEEAGRLGKDWRKLNAQRQREIADQKVREILPGVSPGFTTGGSGQSANTVDQNSDNQKSRAA